VPVDWSSFEKSLAESRVYRFSNEWYVQRLKKSQGGDEFEILRSGPFDTDIRGSHVVWPGNPDGARPIEERLAIDLPEEVHDFYHRWDGAWLFYREQYDILSVAQIIETAIEMREIRDEPMELPWNVLRFCDMGDGNYLALRRKGPLDWEVIWADASRWDAELVKLADPRDDACIRLDASFFAWLRRMDDTDGWPWGESIALPRDTAPSERIG